MARLANDIDQSQVKRIFEVLSQETNIFQGYGLPDIEEIMGLLKVCQFKK